MAIDKDAIREHVRGILAALGDIRHMNGCLSAVHRLAHLTVKD